MRAADTLIPVLFLVSHVAAAAPSPADFQAVAAISGEFTPNAPVRVALPAEVLSKARPDLADLRLFDDADRETPYVVYEQSRPAEAPLSHAFEIVSYQKTDDAEELLLAWKHNASFSELDFVIIGKDFQKRVEVSAGSDAANLRALADDVIFDFSSRVNLRRTHLRMPETRAEMVRIRFQDVAATEAQRSPEMKLRYEGLEFWTAGTAPGPFRVERVMGISGERSAEKEYDRVTLAQPAAQLDKDNNTIIDLKLRLPAASVTLDVANPYYHRTVQLLASPDEVDEHFRVVGSGVVYKVPGMPDSENELSFRQPAAFLRLKVLNEDNPPLRIQNVELAWVRWNLYFVPEAGRSYRLFVGSEETAPPRYELRSLIPENAARLSAYPPLSLAALQINPAFRPPVSREPLEKLLLTVLVVLLVSALSIWAYRLMKTVPRVTDE